VESANPAEAGKQLEGQLVRWAANETEGELMGALALAEVLEPQLELTPQEAILVRRGRAAIRRGHHEMLEVGKVLLELKQIAPPGRFLEIVKQEFGLSRDLSSMWMRLAEHRPFTDVATSLHVPKSPYALDQLRRLNDQQFEAAIAQGDIHSGMSVREAEGVTRQYLGKDCLQPETKETGAAWHDVAHGLKTAPAKPHRPDSAKCGPAVAPRDVELGRALLRQLAALHLTWPEMLWLMIDLRESIPGQYEGNCLSQAGLDQLVGWGLFARVRVLEPSQKPSN
jgi:hypothetical protein